VGHAITAVLLSGAYDATVADRYDLRPVPLGGDLTLFHVDHYFTAYWQAACGAAEWLDIPLGFPAIFPREGILDRMVTEMTRHAAPTYALVMTDYFGGAGGQWACLFSGGRRTSAARASINDVLAALGVHRVANQDEFDTAGLGLHRAQPDYLERYVTLCDDLGV
jgi:hypothetical protein